MTTTKQLADQLRAKVTDVKQVLRQGFPSRDFTSPDRSLTPEEIQQVEQRLPAHLEARRNAPSERAGIVVDAPLPGPGGVPVAVAAARPLTPRAGRRVRLLVHSDVVDFLTSGRGEDRPRQAAVQRLMRGMLVEGRAQRSVKGTRGVNHGWLRAPVGDNGGSHYYLWHALAGTPCVAGVALAREEIAIRAVRHHDATKDVLSAGQRGDYLELDAKEYVASFEECDGATDVLSRDQRKAYDRPGAVTITKGHPGAGKTTLHLERTRRHAGPILFMTFGAAQRAQGERWLETYAPDGQVFRAWTHQEFFQRLDASYPDALPLEEALPSLRAAVAHVPRLGPWKDHWRALHAELRGWYWGRALPFGFRGAAPVTSDDDLERSYRHRRTGTLSEPTIDATVQAARALSPTDRARLFGDLDRARALARRLVAGDLEVPAELADLDAMLIDEVQDLTLIEALVCALVAQRPTAATAARPAFHVAGDEGQTVRATDFDWGELKDLVNTVLGQPTEFELPGNLRSPRTITKVINHSWDLYRTLAKRERPRGYAAAEVDEAAVGSVLWVDAAGDGLREVCGVAAATPGAALVYPDLVVPAEVREVARATGVTHVLTAPEAKGLDFRVAFVVDVARRALALQDPRGGDDEAEVGPIEDRIAIDAIRVALSRSTEVLVFVERPLGPRERACLAALCSEADQLLDGVVTEVAAAELKDRLDVDTSDRVEIVTAALVDFDRVFEDDLEAGLRIIEGARGWLGDSNRASAVQGELRHQVYRAYGTALLRTALARADQRVERLTLANRELRWAKEPEVARVAIEARDAFASTDKLKAVMHRISELVLGADGSLARIGMSLLHALLDDCQARSSGFEHKDWERVVAAIALVIGGGAESPQGSAASAKRARLAQAAVEWALLQRASKPSTSLVEAALKLVEAPPAGLRARVAERREDWDAAIDLYLVAGLPAEALRLSRQRGTDVARSLRLAREAGDPSVGVLERLSRIHADLSALSPAELTAAERAALAQVAKDRTAPPKP